MHLDFRQHFFDQPGTPLMLLSAGLWAILYAAGHALGLIPSGAALEQFTFDHLPLLFTMIRGATLAAALVSVVLLFWLASRLTNPLGGCVAALLLAMSPIYAFYNSLIRTESFAVSLELASTLCLLRALRVSKFPKQAIRDGRRIFAAGLLAGLAAAFRLHSLVAVLPLLVLLLLLTAGDFPHYPVWLARSWKYVLAAAFAVALATATLLRAGYLPATSFGKEIERGWPHALQALYPFLLLVAGTIGMIWLLGRFSPTRWLAGRLLHPRFLILLAGCIAGFLAGTPTILWRSQYFLKSISFYTTTYVDVDRAKWPFLKNAAWLVNYYLHIIAPRTIDQALPGNVPLHPTGGFPVLAWLLLAAGAVLIVVRRDRLLWPFLATAVLFFFSKPLNLRAASHHIIPWLPFYAIIAGYAAAQAYDALSGRIPHARVLRPALASVLIVMLAFTLVRGPQDVAAINRISEEREQNIAQATQWIRENTEPNSVVAISYFCFNPDVFFAWLRYLEVPLPDSLEAGRRTLIWWGDHSALQGLAGYACLSPHDVPNIKDRLDLGSPGQGTNPYTDPKFRRLASFGTGENQTDVFRFDFTQPERH